MIRTVLIGSGNLAYHAYRALSQAEGVELVAVAARNAEALSGFGADTPRASLEAPLPGADLYLLAVSDKAIAPLAARLAFGNGMAVHTSGAQDLGVLDGVPRRGVFYPLQTFSKGRPMGFEGLPVLLEAASESDVKQLEQLACALGARAFRADSAQRLRIHLAAVFANNFTNHLAYLGESICRDGGIDPDVLQPLLLETVAKAVELGAFEAQTGPARRGDQATLERHRELLKDPVMRELYDQLTQSIQTTYEPEP